MTAPVRPAGEGAAVVFGVLAVIMFSSNFVATRHGLAHGLGLPELALIRYGVSGLIALPLLLRLGLGGLSWKQVALLVALGGIPYFLFTAIGLLFAPASHAAVLNPGGVVTAAPLLGWLLLRERPSRNVLLCLPILLAGLLLVGGAGLMKGAPGAWIGDLILYASGVQWACYGIALRAWNVPGLRGAAIITAGSLPWLPIQVLALGPAESISPILANPEAALIQVVFQGLVVGVGGTALYSVALSRLGPARAAMFPPLVPALGTLWAALLLGEVVTLPQVIGAALVILGMVIGTRR
ncbi:DMT family transporter [Acetobacteraceae bacterium H6797]|nr:DMT family transporter [Acetobacteraceae bacterium H6797]